MGLVGDFDLDFRLVSDFGLAVYAPFGAPPPHTGGIAMAFIGVDPHQNSFTIYRLEADGREIFRGYQLAARFGLVPRVSQSNETDNRGPIKDRRGAGKAINATVRQLLSIIFDTLKNSWVFEDFPSFKIRGIENPYGQTS